MKWTLKSIAVTVEAEGTPCDLVIVIDGRDLPLRDPDLLSTTASMQEFLDIIGARVVAAAEN